jgi:FKBP-type peptidyl-prolyl cis-trans isomerase
MKKIVLLAGFYCALTACSTQGVEKSKIKEEVVLKNDKIKSDSKKGTALNSDDIDVTDTKSFDNGIVISWLKHGKGEKVSKGEVILIDYKVTLKDGSIVDGNHLWKKETFPFVVGYQMQTKGWDFAIQNMRVGDFARVLIPADLARGEKGIKKEGEKGWFVPPNSINYLTIHIVKKQKPTRVVDGTKVWLFEENKAQKKTFNENNGIVFHSMISSESNPMYYNSYRTNSPYTLYMTDKGIIPGLKKALINAKKGDRMLVVVPSSEAYGAKGSTGFVKPNEDLMYNILVMDVVDK